MADAVGKRLAELPTWLYLNELGEVLLWLCAGCVWWYAYTVGWVGVGAWWAGGVGFAELLLLLLHEACSNTIKEGDMFLEVGL